MKTEFQLGTTGSGGKKWPCMIPKVQESGCMTSLAKTLELNQSLLSALQRRDYAAIDATPSFRRSLMGSIEILESIKQSESKRNLIPANDSLAAELESHSELVGAV